MPERPYRLLFVCTANICRSPMAEELARMYAEERGFQVVSRSAGTHAMPGEQAAPNSRRAIRDVGGDLEAHRSQPVSDELVEWADRILVMEMRHAQHVREHFPPADPKVQMLGPFGGSMEIADPYGSWIFRYRSSRDEIRRCVEALLDQLPTRVR
ncbi:MAG: low molecular weight protein arginine phosphatase [Deltaproteobacteria bacterium]|nr:low molecular weight protein arginine phosphatase [Deltaproteobacteria bacterium]